MGRQLRGLLRQQVQGTESPSLGHCHSPSSSSPVCSQKTPSAPWACPAGGVGKEDPSVRPFKGLPETGVGKQTLRRRPHNGASGNSHLLYVIKWPTDWKEGWMPGPGLVGCKAQDCSQACEPAGGNAVGGWPPLLRSCSFADFSPSLGSLKPSLNFHEEAIYPQTVVGTLTGAQDTRQKLK